MSKLKETIEKLFSSHTDEQKEAYFSVDGDTFIEESSRTAHTFADFIKTAQVPFSVKDDLSFHPELMAGTDIVGNKHMHLWRRMNKSCLGKSGVSIVQPSGLGKSKNALALCKRGFVVPWRFHNSEPLLSGLRIAQDTAFRELKDQCGEFEIQRPTPLQVKELSDYCLNLTRLSLLALFAFALEFLPKVCGGDNDTYENRYRFASGMWLSGELIPEWMEQWFESHLETVKDEGKLQRLKDDVLGGLQAVCGKRKIIVFLDEAHVPMSMCRGYVQHQSSETSVEQWIQEVVEYSPANGTACTNLLYQLRHLMVTQYLACTTLRFVLCSTHMEIWDVTEINASPLLRDDLTKFFQLHFFQVNDVKSLLQKYFYLDDAFFKDQGIQWYLSRFRHPLFLENLIHGMWRSRRVSDYLLDFTMWSKYMMGRHYGTIYAQMREKLELLKRYHYSRIKHTSCCVVKILYMAYKVWGGIFCLPPDDGLDPAVVQHGFAKIDSVANEGRMKFKLADDICADIVSTKSPEVSMEDGISIIGNQWWQPKLLPSSNIRILAWVLLMTNRFHFSPSQFRRAGRSDELEIDEDDFVRTPWKYPFILLPRKSMGPALFYSWKQDEKNIVYAVACRSSNKICNPVDLRKALRSLCPYSFYGAKEKRGETWDHEILNLLIKWQRYYRLVFNAAGFTSSTYYVVSEHNYGEPWSPIVLCSLKMLRASGLALQPWIDRFCRERSMDENKLLGGGDPIVLQHQWNSLSTVQRLTTRKSKLQSYCRQREIFVTNDSNKEKRKRDLLNALNVYKPDERVREICGQLHPHGKQ